jgi:hypothetical protein
MKPFFLLLSFIISLQVTAQWAENFTDGNFNVSPVWTGDSTRFIVNPSFQLQLNAAAEESSAYLSTFSNVSYKAAWTFKIKMDFNPSPQNYAKVYLMSSTADITGSLQGYYLKIGGTNDDLCLYKQMELAQTLIADGRDKIFNTTVVNAQVRVTRDELGNWSVYCDTTGGNNFSLSAQGSDNTVLQSAYFGIQCFYTQTRSTKFSFDDFEITGELYTDCTKPFIEKYKVLDKQKLLIAFSEPIDSSSVIDSNFNLGSVTPSQIIMDTTSCKTVELTFDESFSCMNNLLQIKNIADLYGLSMNDTVLSFQYCTPQLFDVVINELMVDPAPSQGLPDAEYLELYNRSDKLLDLTGWQLFIGSKAYTFPDIKFPAGSYLLVTSKTNESKFLSYGSTVGLFTSSTTLNNTGQFLKLENKTGQLIAWMEYDDSWYGDDFKAEGGWSLEQIDLWNVCRGRDNWRASHAEDGGTPGRKNSVYAEDPDITAPYIYHINIPADTLIDLYFNEPVDSIWANDCNSYEIVPGMGSPRSAKIMDSHFMSLRLSLTQPFDPGQTYSLKIGKDISDCAGNIIARDEVIVVGVPVRSDSTDIIINEVLFNAKPDGSDYVELYNRSNKIINARQVLLGLKVNGKAENLVRLSETGFLIYPSSYLLVTKNIDQVKAFYSVDNDKNFDELSQMPSLDDHTGTIILMNDNLRMIDEFTYSENMHLSSLRNVEGISLERVSADKPADFTGNWHSAAETSGYGTPGYRNSQHISDTISTEAITIVDNFISPDNDGNKDVLQIIYQFDKPGCRVQVYVFDAMGRLVRRLLNNELLGTEGSFTWDGISDAGRTCNIGMYIIFIRVLYNDGTVREFKKSCILAIRK